MRQKIRHLRLEVVVRQIRQTTTSNKREVEAEARVLLAWLRRRKEWYRVGNEEDSISVQGRLLHLLSGIKDEGLRVEVEGELKKRPPADVLS